MLPKNEYLNQRCSKGQISLINFLYYDLGIHANHGSDLIQRHLNIAGVQSMNELNRKQAHALIVALKHLKESKIE